MKNKRKFKKIIIYIALSLLIAVLSSVLLTSLGLVGSNTKEADSCDCGDDIARIEQNLLAISSEFNQKADHLETIVSKVENSKENNYIGTWYFIEPFKDVSMLEAGKNYKFAFSCYINGSFETHNYSYLYIYQANDEYYTLRYGYDDGTSVLAYRSKYGEFSANSYQIITVESEPCDEIKAFLDANALYMGRLSSEYLNMLDGILSDLDARVDALEGTNS